jgi:hypothetical protein
LELLGAGKVCFPRNSVEQALIVGMERRECFCNEQFNVKACSVQGIYKTADVLAKDPASLTCSNRVNLISMFSSFCFCLVNVSKWRR